MLVNLRRLFRIQPVKRYCFSTENNHATENPSTTSKAQPQQQIEQNIGGTVEDVQRLMTNQYDFLKFSSLFRRTQIDHTQKLSLHKKLPSNQIKKLQAIEQYMYSLTSQQLRYLQYRLAHEVKTKRHNKGFPDQKRQYYYELGFFGKNRIHNLQNLLITDKETASKSVK